MPKGTAPQDSPQEVDAPSEETGSAAVQHPARARVLVWLLVVTVLAHTALIALWVGPDNPIRQQVGASTLRSYAVPVFEQNWQIFAPTPRRVAVEFEFRARILDADSGEVTTSDWINAVDGEDALIRGNPFPPRMSLGARRITNRLNAAMREMNAEQREQIEAHYRTTSIAELRPRLLRGEGDSPASEAWVDRYLLFDGVAVEFATYYASNLWDGEVVEVQYRTSSRYVPTYASRGGRTIDDAERNYNHYGWRAAPELDEDTIELFSAYVEKAMGK